MQRYTYSLAVLKSAFLPYGFIFSRVHEQVMRMERGTPVTGLYCALSRNAHHSPEAR